MSQGDYIKAFDVMVYHTFFDTGKCNSLHFIPDPVTETVFRKFGVRMNRISNGFELFLKSNSSLTDTLHYISKTTSLDYFEFNIESDNPFFALFTAMPINFAGQLTYTSQDPKNQDSNGVVVLNETLQQEQSNSFLGSLRISFEDLTKTADTSPSHFEIKFTARATQWQYYVINKNAVPLNHPVINEKGKMQFDGPQQVVVPTGEKALLFTSGETDLPLSEKPKYKFDLISQKEPTESDQKNSGGKVLLKGLPVPDVSRIGIIGSTGTIQVTSPMYIYL
ncbi:hypothetical protein D0809_08585 [Flavobacterium circumlabens]|uniref:Uncharacterized protein n=1 Tax=Flavobacterium circumlabens TaxID=2133765 RepID=A0A4Y7UFH1_9FLAO|nr:hypothetical protein [Flavobacterium circumlabens]TCN59972.1 hypothetical protein EV142_102592 [Flavobacterium circumlabens]TEB45213.1 hypothetical protein D0809_08585 [Flavobacterium circumlabens]